MSFVEEVVIACVTLIKAVVSAKQDADQKKAEDAMMAAIEELSRIHAKAKFG